MRKHFQLLVLLLAVALSAAAQTGSYTVSRVYPLQQDEVGAAKLTENGTTYTLSNNVLSASFVKEDGTLRFGGCDAMNLKAGTELFRVAFGTGNKVVNASEMTLNEITTENLTGDFRAVNGAAHFNGKALKARFTYKYGTATVTVNWQAILRDGSHYLRTDLTLTGSSDVKLFNIVPMLYDHDAAAAGSTPKVVGNTRGAILASDKIFAGLETPTGINSVEGSASSVENPFNYSAWKVADFASGIGEETPSEIISMGYTANQVVCKRGYLYFEKAGSQTVTFQYASGNHRLNIVGVDVVDLKGKVVASDYHYGYTGGLKANNVYTLNIPTAETSYLVRYFVEVKTETVESTGTITFSQPVTAPTVMFDLVAGSAPAMQKAPALKALSGTSIDKNETLTDSWTASSWKQAANVPSRINELGYYAPNVYSMEQNLRINSVGTLKVEFNYASGNNRLNMVGVDLLDGEGNVVVSDYHAGYTGNAKSANVYSMEVPFSGNYTIRYFVQNKDEAISSSGNIKVSLSKDIVIHLAGENVVTLQGLWSRNTTLEKGKEWNVSAVIGLVAPGQQRRSVLAYSERERAVPWRSMPAYISWYELNINRNNDKNYTTNMNINQCVDVVKQWKKNLFDKYEIGIGSFVWDDGWDEYGTWKFNPNFPNGFTEVDQVARQMCSGIGAWLGPVGGYGKSGDYRRSYWSGNGGMQLSNPAYYKVFKDACDNLIKSYDFRFFKFDGISGQFSATGPDGGTTGEENAEAIIYAERDIRKNLKEDIFFNTTVGTWASPFWFHITDAVWRQENDYGTIGNNSIDRENWITYRDRLVYKNFVQNSPLCPINTLMTHGFILSKFGSVSSNISYDAVLREMRCAFACGSGMVELYNDYSLMNSINGGKLWGDLAECIKWHRKNADVLPDIHWVGGNPWDGSKANVYGWASWNGRKATLALRNGSNSQQTFTTTLREALDIPASVSTTITLTKAFADQANLNGLTVGTPISIDTKLTLRLPASSVFVFDGTDGSASLVPVSKIEFTETTYHIGAGSTIHPDCVVLPIDASNKLLEWSSSNTSVATVIDGTVTGIAEGKATITAKATDGSGVTAQFEIIVGNVPAKEITFDAASYEVLAGESVSITATVLPHNASNKELTWASSNEAVATVADGLVTGVAEGEAVITATSQADPTIKQTATVVVKPMPPYNVNFDMEADATRTDRYLKSITLTPESSSPATLTLNTNHKPYQDLTDQEIAVKEGEQLNVAFDYAGTWMHGYVFVDEDNDGQFNVGIDEANHSTSGDVKTYAFFSFSDSEDSGWNSLGTAISGSGRNVLNPPAFNAPAKAGKYRIRFKIDWNSLDPGGNKSTGNPILGNGGSITDATLVVGDVTGISTPVSQTEGSAIFDLQGRRVAKARKGIYIVGGKKIVK